MDFSSLLIPVSHAHKGKCHDQLEQQLGGKGVAGWDELSAHLAYLMRNSGLRPSQLTEQLDVHDRLGL